MAEPIDRSQPLAHWTVAASLLALSLVLTTIVALRTEPLDPDQSCCDMLYYRSMAFNLFRVTRPDLNVPPPAINLEPVYDNPYYGQYYKRENQLNRQPPFVYRPVAPLLARAVSALPAVSIEQAFYAITFLSIVATGWLMGLAVHELSRDLLPAVTTVAVIGASYRITGYHLWNSMMIDPLAFALLAFGVWLMIRRIDPLFYAVLLVGVFTKETLVLLGAAHLVQLIVERRLHRSSVVAYGLIGSCYLIFRLAMPIPNDALTIENTFLARPSLLTTGSVSVTAFGVLAIFAASRIWFCRTALYLIPLPLGLLVAGMFTPDQLRLVVYAFPLVYLAAFAHHVQGALARALLISPGALYVGFRLLDEWFVDLPVTEWALIYVVAFVAIEPLFFAITGWLPVRSLAGRLRTG